MKPKRSPGAMASPPPDAHPRAKSRPAALPSPIVLTPIGVIESPWRSVSDHCDYKTPARLRLRDDLLDALKGVEYFSHLWVIYHQHRSAEWLRGRGWAADGTAPLVLPECDDRSGQGVFSSRAPCRPSGLGSCIVELLERRGTLLTVRGLDALDGTPLLDIKVYVPQFDAFPGALTPLGWASVLAHDDDATRATRWLHWDTTGPEFALGLRAGLAAMKRLGTRRNAPGLHSRLAGSLFFAQGWELATGCTPLRATLALEERDSGAPPWEASLAGSGKRRCRLALHRLDWPDAAAVMAADNRALFAR
ncbi:tRNA (N6-threonylcarbamoyladenosine(37)-N6)-methyltransferase TrmO [Termitidicoccus mucosus]